MLNSSVRWKARQLLDDYAIGCLVIMVPEIFFNNTQAVLDLLDLSFNAYTNALKAFRKLLIGDYICADFSLDCIVQMLLEMSKNAFRIIVLHCLIWEETKQISQHLHGGVNVRCGIVDFLSGEKM